MVNSRGNIGSVDNDPRKKYLLRCTSLTKEFGRIKAINNLDFTSNVSSLGLFGPNGSGKSTLIKLMMGLIYPTHGLIELGTEKSNIRYIPDFPKLPGSLTVDDWLNKLELIFGEFNLNIDIQEITGLDGYIKIKNLSAGQYRLAALLPVFYGKPELIILDEPTNFLDMIIREEIVKLLKKQIEKEKSRIIIASHKMDEIISFSESVLMLEKGKNVSIISMSLKNRDDYVVYVDNLSKFAQLLDKAKLTYRISNTFTGDAIVIKMSWAFWKLMHSYTKNGGTVHSLRVINDLEETLGLI